MQRLAAASWRLAACLAALPAAAAGSRGLRAAQPTASHVASQLFPEALEDVVARAAPQLQAEAPKTSHTIMEAAAEARDTIELLHFLKEDSLEAQDPNATVNGSGAAQDQGPHVLVNVSGQGEEEQWPPASWMSKCLAHVKSLVLKLDGAYTDVNLHRALVSQCEAEESFPHSAAGVHGFESTAACEEFSVLLMQAREDHLATGSSHGYVRFCERYHAHKYGRPEPKAAEAPPPEAPENKSYLWIVLAIAIVALCISILYCMVQRSHG